MAARAGYTAPLTDIRGLDVVVKTINPILAFNRGRISRLGLARVDLQQKLPWAAEIQTNWMPRVLGSMMLRPGLEYTGGTHNNNYAIHIPFIKSSDDTAIIELTNAIMRVKIDEDPITRESVSTAITNGTFATDLSSWTDADEAGATSQWNSGLMQLTGTGTTAAIRYQAVSVAAGDLGKEHALEIDIESGPVAFRVGSSIGGSEYIRETQLGTGFHSIAIIPGGTFYVQFSSYRKAAVYVDSVAIAAAGIMTVTAPWAEDDLDFITSDQSVDVVYVACKGYSQYKIERRGTGRSWSIVAYAPEDGPFRSINVTTITMTPGATSGSTTLTASQPFFETGHVGALFRLNSGVARVVNYTSPTQVIIGVIDDFSATTATDDWYEGLWSSYRGFPTAVSLHDGRLWWFGRIYYVGSVSGAYESFDDTITGDSAPIVKTIPYGPVDVVNWAISIKTLLMGTTSLEWSIRASTNDEVLTPSNTRAVSTSSQGSTTSQTLKLDNVGVFIQQSGTKIYSTGYDPIKENYITEDLCKFVPEIGEAGFTRMAIQRQPDTRIHAVRADGTVGILISESEESVRCWIDFETDGTVEDVFTMPGTGETKVYYCVKRTTDDGGGPVTVRYLERWAKESECVGGTVNKQADSFLQYSGPATDTITGLEHLEGKAVIVWGNGKDFSTGYDDDQTTFTVINGQIHQSGANFSNAVVGLPYESFYKSTKMAYGGALGTALNQNKKIDHLGLILADTHAKGLRYGPDEDNLDPLPEIEDAADVDDDVIHESYDHEMIEFDGEWTSDSRLCLKAQAPRPCTILAATVRMTTS